MKMDNVIAERKNKVIYRDGDKCIKVFNHSFSKADILNEALNQARVEDLGLNVPKILEVTTIDGKWAILDKASGSILFNTFTDSTDFCYLNWNEKDRRINLEQWGKTVDLVPGKASTIETTYELRPLSRAPWK